MSTEPEEQNALPSLREAVFGPEEPEKIIPMPNGKWCRADDIDFSWQHLKMVTHLAFLQRLNEQQKFNIPPDRLIEMAIKLMQADAIDDVASTDNEEQLAEIALAIRSISRAIDGSTKGEDDENE